MYLTVLQVCLRKGDFREKDMPGHVLDEAQISCQGKEMPGMPDDTLP